MKKEKKQPRYKNPASAKNGLLGGRPKEWTDEVIEGLGEKLKIWAKKETSKYLEEFCSENDTYPQKMSEFSDKNSRFNEALKFAKSCLAVHIAKNTEVGNMPPAWGIFAMKNIAKWTDKQEVEHSGNVAPQVTIYIPDKK